mgnify:CR=1 FL=1
MQLPDHPLHDDPAAARAQRVADRRRLRRAFGASVALVLLLLVVFSAQGAGAFDWRAWTVQPRSVAGLAGWIGAPLLHGSGGHLAANSMALLLLGTLAGSVYPRATLPALPLLWIGGGIGAWLTGPARVAFVIGLDRYFPPAFGRVHPRWKTPYVAILTQAVLATLFLALSVLGRGTTVEKGYLILLDTMLLIYFIRKRYEIARVEREIEHAAEAAAMGGR